MTDFTIRSDNVDVEQIMAQIRMRIKEKRGADYTEEDVRELARVKLERFLDPRAVRSDLVEQYRRRAAADSVDNYSFEDQTIYDSNRSAIRFLRRLLNPILKLFFNPNPVIQVLHRQGKINAQLIRSEQLSFEVLNNLVLELTRLGIEVKNLKMRVEAMSTRLDFDERRARAFEGVVASAGLGEGGTDATGEAGTPEGDAQEARRRRRRRRTRRRPEGEPGAQGSAAHQGGAPSNTPSPSSAAAPPAPAPPPSDTGPGQQ